MVLQPLAFLRGVAFHIVRHLLMLLGLLAEHLAPPLGLVGLELLLPLRPILLFSGVQHVHGWNISLVKCVMWENVQNSILELPKICHRDCVSINTSKTIICFHFHSILIFMRDHYMEINF